MTKREMKAIRDEATAELQAKAAEMQAELAKERSLKSAGTRPENPGRIRKLRRTIAKYFTVINERKIKEKKEVDLKNG